MAKKKKVEVETPEEETPKKSKLVTIYDVNEKAISVPAETAEDLLKLGKGYRKELSKK